MLEPEVLIVGAGPAGISAARVLQARGVRNVMLAEREAQAGGMPRFCPHPTFGISEHFRPMSGPAYAIKLVSALGPECFALATTVTRIGPDLTACLATPEGERILHPKRILLATGIRETPRPARLISGDRPHNILTTGALLRLVAGRHKLPFRRPVIIGTELVAFSAVLALRELGIRPVAMIEPASRIIARRPLDLLTRSVLGVPIRCGWSLTSVNASAQNAKELRSVTLTSAAGKSEDLTCDAVIFTGQFEPEMSLIPGLRHPISHGPAIDQCWETDIGGVYAAGNVLRPVETAAWAAAEGAAAGACIADSLLGQSGPVGRRIVVQVSGPVGYTLPGAVRIPGPALGQLQMMAHMSRTATGRFQMLVNERIVWQSRPVTARPARRYKIKAALPALEAIDSLRLHFEEAGP